jgi:hypothetical protein
VRRRRPPATPRAIEITPTSWPANWEGNWYEVCDSSSGPRRFLHLREGEDPLEEVVVVPSQPTSSPVFSFFGPLFFDSGWGNRIVVPWTIYAPRQTWISFCVPDDFADAPSYAPCCRTLSEFRQEALDFSWPTLDFSVDQIVDWFNTNAPSEEVDLLREFVVTHGLAGATSATTTRANGWFHLMEIIVALVEGDSPAHLISGLTDVHGHGIWI